jgi:hypothetical protein
MIMLLLADAQIILDINGKRAKPFTLKDGTGQGDPISSFLFNLVVQIFIIRIIYDTQINHFKVDNTDMMPEMFADDIHIFLDGQDTQSLTKVMQVTEEFGQLSGLQLSASKTEILGINEAQNLMTQAISLDLKIVDKIKFVGAYVTKQQGKQENILNFEKAFSQINSIYKAWQWRHPSPVGATVIIKSLMTSTLTHLLVNFKPEKQPLADYVKLMKAFVWSGRPQV